MKGLNKQIYRVLRPVFVTRLFLVIFVVIAIASLSLLARHKTATAAPGDESSHTYQSNDGCSGGINCAGWMSPRTALPAPPAPQSLKYHDGTTNPGAGNYYYDGRYFGTRIAPNTYGLYQNYCFPKNPSPVNPDMSCVGINYGFGYGGVNPYRDSTDAKWPPLGDWSSSPYDYAPNDWQHPKADPDSFGDYTGAVYICTSVGYGCSNTDPKFQSVPGGGYIQYNRRLTLTGKRWEIDDVDLKYQGSHFAGAVLDGKTYFPICKSGELESGWQMHYGNNSDPSSNQWETNNCQGGTNADIYQDKVRGWEPTRQMQSYYNQTSGDYIAIETAAARGMPAHPSFAYSLKVTYKEPSCAVSSARVQAGKPVSITLTGAKYSTFKIANAGAGSSPGSYGWQDNSSNDAPNIEHSKSFTITYTTPGVKIIEAYQSSKWIDPDSREYNKSAVYAPIPFTPWWLRPPDPSFCTVTVTPPPLASCSVSTPASPFTGHGVTITVSLKNETAAGGPDFDGNYRLYQTSTPPLNPSDTSYKSGFYLSQGSSSSTNMSYANAARGSPGDVTFYYWLVDGDGDRVSGINGNNGDPLCQTTVTWRQLPVKPYFKVYGGDVFTGGAFDKKDSPCSNSASDYQAPTFGSISTYSKGGIYAFANSQIGASSEYAGFALGNINGSTDTDRSDDVLQYGFYTYGITMPIKQRQNTLSFANELPSVVGSDSTYWGGYFGGEVRQLHCVTDYFYTKKSASTPTVPSVNLATIINGQYLINTSTTTSTPISGNISADPDNNRITIFVKGNVYITGNITYPACTSTSCYGSGSAPKFALIVQGNIYINQNVNQLDGLYIAQPDQTNLANTGVIWTCHDGSPVAYNATFVIGNCNHKLTFNGAVIAKQMNLWRTNDGINSELDTNQPGDPNIPAEEFKYTPEMVIGNPFFNQSNGSQDYTVDSVITLPPVY